MQQHMGGRHRQLGPSGGLERVEQHFGGPERSFAGPDSVGNGPGPVGLQPHALAVAQYGLHKLPGCHCLPVSQQPGQAQQGHAIANGQHACAGRMDPLNQRHCVRRLMHQLVQVRAIEGMPTGHQQQVRQGPIGRGGQAGQRLRPARHQTTRAAAPAPDRLSHRASLTHAGQPMHDLEHIHCGHGHPVHTLG